MSEKITNLYQKDDTSVLIRPNIVSSNIPAGAVSENKTTIKKQLLSEWDDENNISSITDLFEGLGDLILNGAKVIFRRKVNANEYRTLQPVVEVYLDTTDEQSCFMHLYDVDGTLLVDLDGGDGVVLLQDIENGDYDDIVLIYWAS